MLILSIDASVLGTGRDQALGRILDPGPQASLEKAAVVTSAGREEQGRLRLRLAIGGLPTPGPACERPGRLSGPRHCPQILDDAGHEVFRPFVIGVAVLVETNSTCLGGQALESSGRHLPKVVGSVDQLAMCPFAKPSRRAGRGQVSDLLTLLLPCGEHELVGRLEKSGKIPGCGGRLPVLSFIARVNSMNACWPLVWEWRLHIGRDFTLPPRVSREVACSSGLDPANDGRQADEASVSVSRRIRRTCHEPHCSASTNVDSRARSVH